MTELIIRMLFLVVCASIGLQIDAYRATDDPLQGLVAGLVVGLVFILLELALSKRPVQSISAIVFGLITGWLIAIIFSRILDLAITNKLVEDLGFVEVEELRSIVQLSLAMVCCYICVMVIYKTRDNFRFIIPYVEFQKEEKGAHPLILDTSAVIDGRLSDLCDTRVFDTTLIVPKFVLQELQHVADSGDRLRRNRGRRGLEMLQALQRDDRVAIQIHDGRAARGSTVDSKLVSLAGQLQARILTCDYNLCKIAELQNVDAVNLNDIAQALRPAVISGEDMSIKIIRPGDEPGQGVGYLNDGTMVVVDQAREKIGQTATVIVTNTLQTSAGRMIFARIRPEQAEKTDKTNPSEDKDNDKKRPTKRA